MPSASRQFWHSNRCHDLDQLENAHRSVGGSGPGRRYATQQLNHAYAVLLSSQFQGYCRDLHSECADLFAQNIPSPIGRTAIRNVLVQNRKLDRGNPNAGNIGDDYNRLGLEFWTEVKLFDSRNHDRRAKLDELNRWRNAIAHQDFSDFSGVRLGLRLIRDWRNACEQLVAAFDEVMRLHLTAINGISPW